MSKLPVLTAKKLISIIQKLNFTLDHKTGSHFIFYNTENKRRITIPYHAKDLPRGTLLSILKQIDITKEELTKYL